MNFLYPFFLIAGLALAIPVIIHLFNFRKFKKVWFPDIRFLKELQEQTDKQSKLKHLLVLLSRLLAIASLVLAFAQPFFSKDKDIVQQGPKAISIYIDNSFSMGLSNQNLSMLDVAKGKAKNLIESYSRDDLFHIITNDFGANENKLLSKQEALSKLSTIQLSTKSRVARTIIEKQYQLLQTEFNRRKQLIFISDFQKNNFPQNTSSEDSIKKFFVSVSPSDIDNISIDTVYFETPSLLMNEPNPMVVKIKNNSDEEKSTTLTLNVNNQLKSVVNTTLKPNESKSQPIEFSTSIAGNQNIQLYLQDNPVSFDDTFYVSGKVNSNYSVLILNQSNANAFLSSVFRPGAQFRIDNHNVAQVQIGTITNYSLLILNSINNASEPLVNAIKKYIESGGNVLIFPPINGGSNAINSILSGTVGASLGSLDTSKSYVTSYQKSHELFRDVFTKTPENIDLPIVFKHYRFGSSAMASEQKLFTFSNGESFLSEYKYGSGKIYLCASAADANASTFPKSYWFLPVLYKMAFSNKQNAIQAITLGKNANLYIDNNKISDKTIYHLSKGKKDAIPEQRAMGSKMLLNLNNSLDEAGIYSIFTEGVKDSQYVGVNYDRRESDMSFWKLSDLKEKSKFKNAEWIENKADVTGEINELQHGFPLWKLCVILALSFLLIEILLIRFWK